MSSRLSAPRFSFRSVGRAQHQLRKLSITPADDRAVKPKVETQHGNIPTSFAIALQSGRLSLLQHLLALANTPLIAVQAPCAASFPFGFPAPTVDMHIRFAPLLTTPRLLSSPPLKIAQRCGAELAQCGIASWLYHNLPPAPTMSSLQDCKKE